MWCINCWLKFGKLTTDLDWDWIPNDSYGNETKAIHQRWQYGFELLNWIRFVSLCGEKTNSVKVGKFYHKCGFAFIGLMRAFEQCSRFTTKIGESKYRILALCIHLYISPIQRTENLKFTYRKQLTRIISLSIYLRMSFNLCTFS